MRTLIDPKKRRADLYLIGGLLLAGLLLAGGLFLFRKEGAVAVVTVNGAEVARYPLDRDGVYVLNGGSNTLVIRDGGACITNADCPDRLCEKQGVVRYAGQTVTCLPNRVQVRVIGGEGGTDTEAK